MAVKVRAPKGRMLLLSGMIGLLVSFGYEPLYGVFVVLIKDNLPALKNYEELAAGLFLGIFYIGILIYFFSEFILGVFSKSVLSYLVKELRNRQLLPVKYKMKKTRLFGKLYEEIIIIFDSFIRLFCTVKKDRDKFHKMISTHLDPAMAREIDERPLDEIYLGGKTKNATILFSDIRGFTSFTENNNPDDVVMVLNEYFSVTTRIINNNRGNVNKYIGDAVLGVFEEGPKISGYNDADKAVTAALDIQSRFDVLLSKWEEKIGHNPGIGLGIGLAKGRVVAGTIGSEERMEYTVIGDAVNFASRLCSIAGPGQVIIETVVYEKSREFVEAEKQDPVSIKGKTGLHDVYLVKTRKMLR